VNSNLRDMYNYVTRDLWDVDTSTLGPPLSYIVKAARYVHASVRLLNAGQLTLRAMGLVYTTLLSLVPLLAVSFSVLKAFGVHNQAEPLLLKFLAPLGPKGEEITATIIEFVGNMKVGVLGSIGLALLIYTVVSLIYKVEESFNHIWRVTNPRSMARRFTDYMSFLLVGPILIFSSMGISAAFMSSSFIEKLTSIGVFGYIFFLGKDLVPYVMTCAAFTFAYVVIPSTRVKFRPALVGGLLAGLLWEISGWGFAQFVVTSTKYSKIYSGFAILIMFMIWVYISWLILLIGATVSFYHQHPQYLTLADEEKTLSNRLRERMAFSIMYLVGESYRTGSRGWSLEALVDRLVVPIEPLRDTLALLEKKGLLVATADEPASYVPARDMETILLTEVLDAARTAGEHPQAVCPKRAPLPAVDELASRMGGAMSGSVQGMTLRDLVASGAVEK